ncbi:hypothetical protein FAES_0225 [Fibrella aestuarina BUZ 2]|uniref:DUF2029 domain-containing protein n=1 Tax=Fibrella aestuarina BUZ 2 TaxID=1166018 RepID=I0K286_9BACT|nr:hypothetical protein [Fibrella aestuarina]CCG98239.1 hypothetical protein FAES_0225 [Fibrella aestuarina BUZ 2]
MNTLLLKIALVVLATIGCLTAGRFRTYLGQLKPPQTYRLLVGAFVLCRIVPFVGIYLVLGLEPRSDVPLFYEAATQALWGDVVYRDFWSPYSPLFSYFTGLPLLVWHDVRMITLQMLVLEGIAWWLTYQLARQTMPARNPTFLAILYLMLPAPLVFAVLGGQEDILMWLFALGSVLVWHRWRNAFWLGVWWAVALLTTKALTLFVVLAVLAWVARPWRYVLGLATVGIPALALTVWLTGEKMLTPLAMGEMRFAPNLWTVAAPLIGDFMAYAGQVSAIGLVAMLLISGFAGWKARQASASYERALPMVWVVVYGSLMLVHKSSFGNYAYIILLPLVLLVIDWQQRRDVVMLLILSAASAIHPTLWWSLNEPIYTRVELIRTPLNVTEYCLGLVMLISVAYFVRKAFQQLVTKRQIPRRRAVLT